MIALPALTVDSQSSWSGSRVPLRIWVLWILFLVRGSFYCAMLPLWEGWDEYAHFAYLQHLVDRPLTQMGALPHFDSLVSREIDESMRLAPLAYELRSLGPPYLTNEQWWALPESERNDRQRRLSALSPEYASQPAAHSFTFYEAQQPPLYYWLFSIPLRFVTSWHLWTRVLLVRLLSMTLASLAIPLTWLAAGEALGFWCAALIAVAPGFALDVCRVANDSLAIALAALLFLLIVRRAGWVAVGGVLGLALLAKAYLLAIVPAVLLRRRSVYEAAPALAIAGWWYVRNLMMGLPFTGWIQHADTAQALAAIVHIHWFSTMQVIANTFIWFGAWSFLTLKSWMYAVVEAIAAIAGLSALRRRNASLDTAFAFAACFVLATLYGMPVTYSIQKIAGVPGWYAWSIVTPLALIVAAGMRRATTVMISALALIDLYGVAARLVPFYAGLVDRNHAAISRFPEALAKLHIPPVFAILWAGATVAIPVFSILLTQHVPNQKSKSGRSRFVFAIAASRRHLRISA